MKLGVMYLTTVAYASYTDSAKNQLQKLMLSSMQRVMGADIAMPVTNTAKIETPDGLYSS